MDLHKQLADAKRNIRLVRKLGVRGGTLLDLGANIGEVAIQCADLFDQIVAVEAHPSTAAIAIRRIKDKGHCNITVINAVVSNKSGIDYFVSSPSIASTGATARLRKRLKAEGYYHTVRSISLRQLVQQFHPRFIKMDIEGSEWDVLDDDDLYLWGVEWMAVEFHGITSPANLIRFSEIKKRLRGWDLHPINDIESETWSLATIVFSSMKRRTKRLPSQQQK